MVEQFQQINNCNVDVTYGPRRKGDAAYNVLDNPSVYMRHLYDFNDLLKVN